MTLPTKLLSFLDECAATSPFPVFDIGYGGHQRLSVYCSGLKWALIIERAVFAETGGGHGGMLDEIYSFASHLSSWDRESAGFRAGVKRVVLTADGLCGSTFEKNGIFVNKGATDIRLRGQIVGISTRIDDYSQYSLVQMGSDRIHGSQLLRWLANKVPDNLWETESELLALCDSSMPLVLRFTDWYHPDITNEETPSQNECFQMLADVIKFGDPGRYKPTKPPNTHWRNWPRSSWI